MKCHEMIADVHYFCLAFAFICFVCPTSHSIVDPNLVMGFLYNPNAIIRLMHKIMFHYNHPHPPQQQSNIGVCVRCVCG